MGLLRHVRCPTNLKYPSILNLTFAIKGKVLVQTPPFGVQPSLCLLGASDGRGPSYERMDGRTDGRTDGGTAVYLFSLLLTLGGWTVSNLFSLFLSSCLWSSRNSRTVCFFCPIRFGYLASGAVPTLVTYLQPTTSKESSQCFHLLAHFVIMRDYYTSRGFHGYYWPRGSVDAAQGP